MDQAPQFGMHELLTIIEWKFTIWMCFDLPIYTFEWFWTQRWKSGLVGCYVLTTSEPDQKKSYVHPWLF